MDYIKKLTLLTAFVMLSFGALTAKAVTPALTQLTNQATLTYSGGFVQDSVTVIVALVPAAVVIETAPTDQSAAEGSGLTVSYRVYAQANGEDEYFLTATADEVGGTNIATGTVGSYIGVPTSIFLGASATLATTGTNTFTVPGDNDLTLDPISNLPAVNGLTAGDTVFIAGSLYVIDAIAETLGEATITLNANSVDVVSVPTNIFALLIGEGVFEAKTFDIATTDVGDLDGVFTTGDYDVTTQVSNGADAVTDDFNVALVKVNIDKYVRCISLCTDAGNADGIFYNIAANDESGSLAYSETGISPQQNGVVEYLVKMENSGASDLTAAVLTDVLPDFTSYVSGSLIMNGGTPIAGATFPLDAGLSVGAVAGTIASAEVVYVVYQVSILP